MDKVFTDEEIKKMQQILDEIGKLLRTGSKHTNKDNEKNE